MGPLIGRLIDRLVPWYATLISTFIQLVFQGVQLGGGGINVSAVILACFGLDVGRQMQQVSVTTAVYGVSADARSRLNAILIISIFIGQVVGTAVGTSLFIQFGWRAAAGFSLGLFVFQIGILLLRGPHCSRYTWFGYEGGTEARKTVVDEMKRRKAEEEAMEKDASDQKVSVDGERSEKRLSSVKGKTQGDSEEMGDAKINVQDADLSNEDARPSGESRQRKIENV